MENEINMLLANQDYVFVMGELLAVAILLGGILDRGGKDLISWIVAVSAFAVINGLVTLDLINNTSQARVVMASVLLTVVTYCGGLLFGWIAGTSFRKLYWRRHRDDITKEKSKCS